MSNDSDRLIAAVEYLRELLPERWTGSGSFEHNVWVDPVRSGSGELYIWVVLFNDAELTEVPDQVDGFRVEVVRGELHADFQPRGH